MRCEPALEARLLNALPALEARLPSVLPIAPAAVCAPAGSLDHTAPAAVAMLPK